MGDIAALALLLKQFPRLTPGAIAQMLTIHASLHEENRRGCVVLVEDLLSRGTKELTAEVEAYTRDTDATLEIRTTLARCCREVGDGTRGDFSSAFAGLADKNTPVLRQAQDLFVAFAVINEAAWQRIDDKVAASPALTRNLYHLADAAIAAACTDSPLVHDSTRVALAPRRLLGDEP